MKEGLELGKKEGLEQAKKEGLEQAKKERLEQAKKKLTINLLRNDVPLELISKSFNYTIEELETMKKEI